MVLMPRSRYSSNKGYQAARHQSSSQPEPMPLIAQLVR
jgi:hypothetical protein